MLLYAANYVQNVSRGTQTKGVIILTQVEIIAFIAQTALTYIFVAVATGNASKQATLDQKTDLRTTKEDLFSELKDTREALLRESEISTKATIDILKAEMQVIKQINNDKSGNE